jgi:general stress protein YciG
MELTVGQLKRALFDFPNTARVCVSANGTVGELEDIHVNIVNNEAQVNLIVNMARGFAALTPAQRSEISKMGGRAAHAAGTAHEFTSEEARKAGSKGGKATHAARRMAKNPIEKPKHTAVGEPKE